MKELVDQFDVCKKHTATAVTLQAKLVQSDPTKGRRERERERKNERENNAM